MQRVTPALIALSMLTIPALAQAQLPGPPTDLAASTSGTCVALAWVPPVEGSGGPASAYRIELGSAVGLSNLLQLQVGAPSAVLHLAGRTYYARVRATNSAGAGPPSNAIVFTLPESAPCGFIQLAPGSWTAPAQGGSSEVALVLPDYPPTSWTASSSASWLSVSPTSGTGSATLQLTAAQIPGVDPRNARVTVGAHSVVVVQEGGHLLYVPSDLRVASVIGQQVTLQWEWSADPPSGGFVVEGGVTPGQTLAHIGAGSETLVSFAAPTGSFFVRVHTVADGLRQRPSNEVPLHVNVPVAPSPPRDLLGSASGNRVDLAWVNTFEGGAPTGLTLHVGGALTTTLALGLTDRFSYTGVPPGTYTFAVTASNSSGTSALSNPVTITFPGGCSGAPLAPGRLGAMHLGRVVTVRWDPAASGPAPSDYVLQVPELGLSVPTGTRSLSGTVDPGSYTLSVTARNPCGMSPPSEVRVVVP